MRRMRAGWSVLTLIPFLNGAAFSEIQDLPNPDDELTPRVEFDTKVLEFDFPGLEIGSAEYDEGPTGCTVFHFPDGATAAVDVRGGAPGTKDTDTLRLGYERPFVSAITLAGGSDYGLEAAAGVAAELLAQREYSGFWDDIAVVPAAIIFDLQTRRFNAVYPDKELGRAALRAAREGRFYQGARGAGRFAMQGSYYGDRLYSGQGGAFRQLGPTKVAVFTVVNAVGTVVNRDGQVVRCQGPNSEECGSVKELLARRLESLEAKAEGQSAGLTRNTTITLVVTNQKLSYWALKRLAMQVHTSMARAIQPFHTQTDGDTLFAASTSAIDNEKLSERDLAVLASETAWDAVLYSVPELDVVSQRAYVEIDPAAASRVTGDYRFGAGAELTVEASERRVFITGTGTRTIYGFEPGQRVEIFPVSEFEFRRKSSNSPRLEFDLGPSGAVLIINPGHWPVRGMRR
jgi:L-aminopeptidase/D-esterase-like protein